MTEINIKEMSEFDSFICSKYMESVLWNNGKPTHPLYLDLWEVWQAATQREGFKFMPVDTLDECLNWASVARWDSPSEERDIEIDYHVGIIEAAIGAVDDH